MIRRRWVACLTITSLLLSLSLVTLWHGQTSAGASTTSQTTTAYTSGFVSTIATMVDGGAWFTCAVVTSGNIKCWGWNYLGQLGDGTITDRPTPVTVVGLGNAASVSTGMWHTCAVTSDNSAKCWGYNLYGALGIGTIDNNTYSSPLNVVGLSGNVTAIAAGYADTCAITLGGGLKCWGENGVGQLGDGTTTDRPTPVDVIGLSSGVVAVAVGFGFACALTSRGGVKCWGVDSLGQLGDGSPVYSRTTPVDVVGLSSGVAAISAGGNWPLHLGHACALTSSGDVKCWGDNSRGQVGDGTLVMSRTTPVDVYGLSNGVTSVATGSGHSCAVIYGSVKCWGDNTTGQLGIGSVDNDVHPVPLDVNGLTSNVSAVAAGSIHTCALMSDGGVKCWGGNSKGELGDFTSDVIRTTPDDVVGMGRFLHLPFDSSNFATALQSNYAGSGGLVNTWFDHQYPEYCDSRYPHIVGIMRFDGTPFSDSNYCLKQLGTQGVSSYDGHNGIDFAPVDSQHPNELIYPAAPGIVVDLCRDYLNSLPPCPRDYLAYGNYVVISHTNGYATLYGHLQQVNPSIYIGTVVTSTRPITVGILGSTGHSTGPHLHVTLFYTTNVNGPRTWDDVVDPYGWMPCGPSPTKNDPWNTPPYTHTSVYLWHESICPLKSLDATGAILTSPTGNVKANIPPGAVASTLTLQLGDVPPVGEPSAQLKSVGRSFLLQILEWLLSTGSGPASVNATPSFSEPVTLTATYNVSATRHLDPSQLAIYRWNGVSTWLPLTSTVDLSNTQVTATTMDIGNFDVQAPLLCPTDVSEPDDAAEYAQPILTDGTVVNRLFDIADDEDWIRFDAVAGQKYVIQTMNLAAGVDTVLELYDTSGTNLLAANDNYHGGPASRIDWVAPADGTYFVRVLPALGSTVGCSASYQVSITQVVVPLQADFTATPITGMVPLMVVFTNTSTGPYTSSTWNFGDGFTSTMTSPSHIYSIAGVYTVTLTVSGVGPSSTLTRPGYIVARREYPLYLPLIAK